MSPTTSSAHLTTRCRAPRRARLISRTPSGPGDQDLVQFFREVQGTYRQLADQSVVDKADIAAKLHALTQTSEA
jgi:hypothetical protein